MVYEVMDINILYIVNLKTLVSHEQDWHSTYILDPWTRKYSFINVASRKRRHWMLSPIMGINYLTEAARINEISLFAWSSMIGGYQLSWTGSSVLGNLHFHLVNTKQLPLHSHRWQDISGKSICYSVRNNTEINIVSPERIGITW